MRKAAFPLITNFAVKQVGLLNDDRNAIEAKALQNNFKFDDFIKFIYTAEVAIEFFLSAITSFRT